MLFRPVSFPVTAWGIPRFSGRGTARKRADWPGVEPEQSPTRNPEQVPARNPELAQVPARNLELAQVSARNLELAQVSVLGPEPVLASARELASAQVPG